MESYVLGDLSPEDAQEVERVLARGDKDSQAMAEILKVEGAIRDAMAVPEFSGNVADDVLSRVAKRTQSQLNRKLPKDLAAATVEEALSSGRVTRRIVEGRQRQSRLAVWLRAAVFMALIGGTYAFIIRGIFVGGEVSSSNGVNSVALEESDVLRPSRLGRVRYANVEQVVDRRPILSKARPNDYSTVFQDQVIETNAREGAEVDLAKGGRLLVLPNTRLVIVRGPVHASYKVRLLRGGLRVDTRGRRPLHVASSDTYSGQIEGRGEVELLEESPLQSLYNSHPSMLVRLKTRGGSFQNGTTNLKLKAGDLALLNVNRAVRLAAEDASAAPRPQSLTAAAPLGVLRPMASAIKLGNRSFSRSVVASEMMEVFGTSAAEIIIRSIVIQRALAAQGLSISTARRGDAVDLVSREGRFLAQPLRSRRAVEERGFHLAGLFALENARSRSRLSFDHRTALATYRDGWNRLASSMKVRWHPPSDATALTLLFSDHEILVSRGDVWAGLKSFLRISELDQLVQSLVERECVQLWLAARGDLMPQRVPTDRSDPRLAAAMRSMLIMEGRTEASATASSIIRAAIMPSIRQPSELEVEQFLSSKSYRPTQVMFEHISFPFTNAENGSSTSNNPKTKKAAAHGAAQGSARRWRAGAVPRVAAAGARSSYLWPGLPVARAGPRAWWPQIYGASFTEQVLALSEGQVSEPIEGLESWHVVRVQRRRPLILDKAQARRIAQRVIVHKRIQRRLAGIIAQQTVERLDVSSLLDG